MRPFTKFVLIPSGIGAVSLVYFLRFPRAPPNRALEADDVVFRRIREERLTQIPTNVLLRNLFVHSFCTHPHFVDFGIYLVNKQPWSIPFLSPIIRHSFFKHFCGGETIDEAVELGRHLQTLGIHPMLSFSKEFSDSQVEIENTEEETISCIRASSSLQKPTFVAIKLSGLSSENELRSLERDIDNLLVNSRSGSPAGIYSRVQQVLTRYPTLFDRLRHIALEAQKLDVQLILDAEIRYQGDVDASHTSALLCSVLNGGGHGNVWNTHQIDGKDQLDKWCGNNPVKLVRGAYLYQEPSDKVHGSKEAVDDMYNQALSDLILNRRNSVMLASHNYASILKAISLLPQSRPPAWFQSRIICFGQLYGMGDDITYTLARELKTIPVHPSVKLCVVKCVPYGPLKDVIPYLLRRAEENRGMLAGSMLEREALVSELKRRILETLGLRGIN